MPETLPESLILERRPPLAVVTFNRPAQRNAIGLDMWRELTQILTDLDADLKVRAIVFTGAGEEAFSAGADIQDFEENRSDSVKGRVYNDAVNELLAKLHQTSTPTISMIRGFAIPVARLGITVGHREMQGLVNLVGKGSAMYILLSGRLLDDQEALRIGLVNQVVPASELESYTFRLAEEIANLAPLSHAVNKQTLAQVLAKPSLADLTPEEADLPLTQFDTRDYQEGYRAFLEKRRPSFIGE